MDALAQLGFISVPQAATAAELTEIADALDGFDRAAKAEPVGPHQDLFVPVEGWTDDPGFVRWSDKGAYCWVSPPDEVLRHCLVVRLLHA